MKSQFFSFVAVLASFATAIPLTEITLSIETIDSARFMSPIHQSDGYPNPGICFRICAPERIPCAEGWNPTKLGNCWTCCRPATTEGFASAKEIDGPNYDLTVQDSARFKSLVHQNDGYEEPGVCLLICWEEKHACPEGMKPYQFGECWTCCRPKYGDHASAKNEIDGLKYDLTTVRRGVGQKDVSHPKDSAKFKSSVRKTDDKNPGVCWDICFFEKPNCPEGAKAHQFGDCWTCCWPTYMDLAPNRPEL